MTETSTETKVLL